MSGTGYLGYTPENLPRVLSQVTTTSPFAWNSTQYDEYAFTALNTALTINADSGIPVDGQRVIFRIKDDGTSRALTWTVGSAKSFRAVGITLPSLTTASKELYVGCIFNSSANRWDAVAYVQET